MKHPRTPLALLVCAAAALVGALLLDLPLWYAAPGTLAVWLVVRSTSRLLNGAWVARRLRREGPTGGAAMALDAAARVRAVASGQPGFTPPTRGLQALERATLVPDDAGDERAVLAALGRATPEDVGLLVSGLRRVEDESVAALARPLHPLFPEAPALLIVLGHPRRTFLGVARSARDWGDHRELISPAAAREAVALRLLGAEMPQAAVVALHGAQLRRRGKDAGSTYAGRLARLARFRQLIDQAENSLLLALPPSEVSRWVEEILLLAGRRLPELVPGSPLLAAVPGGARALEAAVARTPAIIADLVCLHREARPLRASVEGVLARVLRRPVGEVARSIAAGTLLGQPDAPLHSHLRGLALLSEGRPREAEAEFEAVLEKAPEFAQAAYALATVRDRIGRRRQGEEVLRALASRRRRDPEAALWLARYLADGPDRKRARAAYVAALERFPRSVALRVAFAQTLDGWGEGAAAARHLEIARRQHPDDARLALLAGRALLGEGRTDRATTALRAAVRGLRGAERAGASFWLMSAYRDRGDHPRALRLARRLVGQLGRGQTEMLEELAEYLEERHDYERAREATERVRRLRGE